MFAAGERGHDAPVRRLLEGTRAVEEGNLGGTLSATSRDEIGQLTSAFNRMVEQLRLKEVLRETFGRYVDPRIVKALIEQPTLASDGQRRVMTVLFCDMKGFTTASEKMTPQGLVKVMNQYFSAMSLVIRNHGGIIDKFIGDAIMALTGASPFNDEDQTSAFGHASGTRDARAPYLLLRADMVPEWLGVEVTDFLSIYASALPRVTSLWQHWLELMMSYTVMGDTGKLASRLERVAEKGIDGEAASWFPRPPRDHPPKLLNARSGWAVFLGLTDKARQVSKPWRARES